MSFDQKYPMNYAFCRGAIRTNGAGHVIVDRTDVMVMYGLMSERPFKRDAVEKLCHRPLRAGYDRWHIGVTDKESDKQMALPMDVMVANNEFTDVLFVLPKLVDNIKALMLMLEIMTLPAVWALPETRHSNRQLRKCLGHRKKRGVALQCCMQFFFHFLTDNMSAKPVAAMNSEEYFNTLETVRKKAMKMV